MANCLNPDSYPLDRIFTQTLIKYSIMDKCTF